TCLAFLTVMGLASTHFVECSTAIARNCRPPGAIGSGPRIWIPQWLKGHVLPTAMAPSTPAFLIEDYYLGLACIVGDELGNEDIEEDKSLDMDDEGERLDDKGHSLDDEGRSLEGEGLSLEDEREAAPEGQQRCALESIEEIAPSTYEVGQSSRSIPEQQGADRVSAFRQPTLTTWVDP
ncbi:hypothetical protein Tco_1180731, partial [Tanacetum coccineum]